MVNSNPQSGDHHHVIRRDELQLVFEMVANQMSLNLTMDEQNHMLDIVLDIVRDRFPSYFNDINMSRFSARFHRFDALRYIVTWLFEEAFNRPDA